MSAQKTTPARSAMPERNLTQMLQYSSDPSLNRSPSNKEELSSLEENVTQRSKRPREEASSPNKFTVFKDEIKDLISSLVGAQSKELASISNKLQELTESNANINAAVLLLTAQNEEYRCKIASLETQTKKDREYISLLEDKVEDLHRQSRKTCLEIKNVPKKPQETRDDLMQMVVNLAKTINHGLNVCDISDIFRSKPRGEGEKKPTIVVELRSAILRSDLLKKVKDFNLINRTRLQAKHLGLTNNEDTPVFINEQLTPKGARLFFLARDLKRAGKYKYCWTSMGKVLIRKEDSSKTIHIQHEAQVQQLMQEQ